MAKIGIFKKIAALATAIAIVVCFAVTAGAVDVSTTTSYVDGNDGDILVEVTISGDEIVDKSVSYYAYNDEGPVFIDQIEDGSNEIFFDYVTENANLNSTVKVGYTGASAAETAVVDGDQVTWGDAAPQYIPTAATEATVRFATEATKVVGTPTVTGADFAADPYISAGFLTVVLENISADQGDVALTIETETEATVEIIDAAFVICAGANDTGKYGAVTSAGDRKLTAIGKAKGAKVYGIIVSATADYTDDNKFQAIANNGTMDGITANGYFAVQLIDDVSDGGATFLPEDAYYVGAYADAAVDMYEVDEVVTPVSIKDLR